MKFRFALIVLPMFAGLQACTLDGSSTSAGDVVIGGAVHDCYRCNDPYPSEPTYDPSPRYPNYRPTYPSDPSQPQPPRYEPRPGWEPHGTNVSSPYDPRRDHEIPGAQPMPIPGGGPHYATSIDLKVDAKAAVKVTSPKVSREALALSEKYGTSKAGSQKIVEAFKKLKAGSTDGFASLGLSDDDMSSVAGGDMPSNEGIQKASAKLGSKASSVEKLMKDVVKQIQFQNELDWMNRTTANPN